MKDLTNEIVISLVAVITSFVSGYTAFHFGKKQRLKNESLDPVSRGADKVVEISERLLERLDESLEKEKDKTHNCEKKIKELYQKNKDLNKKLFYIENQLKHKQDKI